MVCNSRRIFSGFWVYIARKHVLIRRAPFGSSMSYRSTFYQQGLVSIPAWISNHMPSKVWAVIAHPSPNFVNLWNGYIITLPTFMKLLFVVLHQQLLNGGTISWYNIRNTNLLKWSTSQSTYIADIHFPKWTRIRKSYREPLYRVAV